MSEQEGQGGKRRLRGRVVSDKMDKTVVVQVERKFKHPKYQKYITRIRKFAAHDETNACATGDTVVIEESRPLSRTKRWMVVERISG